VSKQELDYYSDEAREKRLFHDGLIYGSMTTLYSLAIFGGWLLLVLR